MVQFVEQIENKNDIMRKTMTNWRFWLCLSATLILGTNLVVWASAVIPLWVVLITLIFFMVNLLYAVGYILEKLSD